MCKAKSKRKDLEAPAWLVNEWTTGNKSGIARVLQEENFDKEKFFARMHVVITRKNSVKLLVEEQWCSRKTSASYEEKHMQEKDVTDPKEMPDVGSLQDLSKIENHANGAGKSPKKAAQENLVKIMDSIMAQISKLRSLMREMRLKYKDSEKPFESIYGMPQPHKPKSVATTQDCQHPRASHQVSREHLRPLPRGQAQVRDESRR
ncbi:unnamed protein product [Symbiodinium necroappetens]|uniref:Uncharacterized protein n=1 Tax=Symbiodinium necroappetens TaxID=1628268 RepID=A0A812MYX8_9DINO|nr:unnamed protein product [Symbiodinium necroappetens]